MAIGLTRQQISQLQLPEFHPEFGRLRSIEKRRRRREGNLANWKQRAAPVDDDDNRTGRREEEGFVSVCVWFSVESRGRERERER